MPGSRTTAAPLLNLVLVSALAWGCGAGAREGTASTASETSAQTPAPAPLASFAPDDVVTSVIIADGRLARIDAAADEVRRIVAGVGSSTVLESLSRELFASGPFDPLDPSSAAGAGIDIDRGAALFVTPAGDTALVFSARDPDRLRTSLGATPTADGFDSFAGLVCKPLRGRVACASSRQLWTQIASRQPATDDSPTGADVAIDVSAPAGGDLLAMLGGPPLGVRAVHVDATLDHGRVTASAQVTATAPAGWLAARRRAVPAEFTSVDVTSVGFIRVRAPQRALRRLPWPRVGPIDLRDILLPELTGDVALVSSGTSPFGLHVVAGLRNSGPVRLALRTTCRLASFAGYGHFRLRGNVCEGMLDVRRLGLTPRLAAWLPRTVPVFVRVTRSSLIVSLISPPHPGTPADRGADEVTRRLQEADWNISAWAHWVDPEIALTGHNAERFRDQLELVGRPADVTAVRALLAHVHDAGLGIRATGDGLMVEASLTTYAADSPGAYRTYSGAAVHLARGDLPAYLQDVAALGKRYGDSLAAHQAGARGLPLAPLAALAALFL